MSHEQLADFVRNRVRMSHVYQPVMLVSLLRAGGNDTPDNLQALCYRCNATKRDRDSTDFRGIRGFYERRKPGRPFCEMPKGHLVAENDLAYAVSDALPVTHLHTLVIPKRNVSGRFELGRAELNACHRLLEQDVIPGKGAYP